MLPIAAVIILTIGIPLLVAIGLRFHMSLYKRGAYPSKAKAPVADLPIHEDDQTSVEDKSDDEVYWDLV